MNTVKQIIEKKPTIFLLASVVYIVLAALLKWGIHPTFDTLWFIVGGFVGIYFLDFAEVFFALNPSPFRSIVFMGVYVVVSFFVTTSSSITLARGLVLSLFLQLLMWQIGEWRITGSDTSWYKMVSGAVPKRTQEWILLGFIVVFLIETYLFIR